MQKLYLSLLSLLMAFLVLPVLAEDTRYVTDELQTYTRSGPGNQYRVVGILNAGEPVTVLNINNEAKYAYIRASSGKEFWLPLAQLSNQPSLRIQVPALVEKVRQLTTELATINQDWHTKTAQMQKKITDSDAMINTLQREKQELKTKLASAENKASIINNQFDDKQRGIIMQWFLYGGAVAGGGLLIGLLLPRFIPRRKNTRWMN